MRFHWKEWLWVLPLSWGVFCVSRFGVNSMVGDSVFRMAHFVPDADGSVHWLNFLVPLGEQTELTTLLLWNALGPLLAWSFRAQMVVNLLITGAIVWILQSMCARILARKSSRLGYFGLVIGIILVSPSQYADILRADVLSFRLAWLAVISGISIATSSLSLRTRTALCALLALAGTYSYSIGYLSWICFAFLLVFHRGRSRTSLRAGLGLLALGIGVVGSIVLRNWMLKAEAASAHQSLGTGLYSFLAVLGNSLGFPGPAGLSAIIGLAILAFFLVCLRAIAGSGKLKWQQCLPWTALCGISILCTLAIGFVRGPNTIITSDIMKSHYIGVSSYFLVGLVGLATLGFKRLNWPKGATAVVLVAVSALFLRSQKAGLDSVSDFQNERAYGAAVLHFINVIDDPQFESQILDSLAAIAVRTGNPAVDLNGRFHVPTGDRAEVIPWLRNAAAQVDRSGLLRLPLAKSPILSLSPTTGGWGRPMVGSIAAVRSEKGRIFFSGWIMDTPTWKIPVSAVVLVKRLGEAEGQVLAVAWVRRGSSERLTWETSVPATAGTTDPKDWVALAYSGESGAIREIRWPISQSDEKSRARSGF